MTDLKHWRFEERDGLGSLTLDVQGRPVNVLSSVVLEELAIALSNIAPLSLKGLVVRSAKSGFIAGADINEIADLVDPVRATAMVERGQTVLLQLEALPYPTVAAIHGACLGGGMELALACRYRVCSDHPSTRLGLPEVKLGIHPGFGGCVRLPKVVGLATAVDWILSGKAVDARTAKKAALVSQAVPVESLDEAARRLVVSGARRRKGGGGFVNFLLAENPAGRAFFFGQAEKRLAQKASRTQYPAPFAALKVLRESYGKGSSAAHRIEAQSCGALIPLDVTKNLVRVFFISERLKHQDAARLGKADAARVAQVTVVGAGVMGAGIAGEFAKSGMVVRLADVSEAALGKGLAGIAKEMQRAAKRSGKGEFARIMSRISPTTDLDRLGRSGLILEAVVEKMPVKKELFARAVPQLRDDALLLTNTSSLSVTDMFEEVPDPSKGVGMHFFNPVSKMPLVEVVVGEHTAPQTVALVTALAARIGKMPLIVQECPGFLVNRILMPYLNEALLMLEEGAGIGQVDQALIAFGMPMGAFRLYDEIGFDVCYHVARVLLEGYGDRMTPARTMNAIFEAGRFGKKTGTGFYKYQNGQRKEEDPAVLALIQNRGTTVFTDVEIVDRAILSMVAEAGRILEEGIVDSPEMLDAGMVFGTGFPPFRGGLMRYVEERGTPQVVGMLDQLAVRHGKRFAPNGWLKAFGTGERGR